MQHVYRWRSGVVLAASVTTALALAVPATPAGAQPPERPVAGSTEGMGSGVPAVSAEAWAAGRARYGANVTAAQAVESYWTPERMRAARPVEEMPAYQAAVRKYDEDVRAAKRRAGDAPDRGVNPRAATPHRVEPKAGKLGTPAVRSDAVDPNWDIWHPTARTSGKVFLEFNGAPGRCSATIVNSEGQNTVWTAGHCAVGGGVWATNWLFVPAYDDDLADPRPHGTWGATVLWAPNAWVDSSDFSADMAVAIMAPNFGSRIVAYFGGQGITTGIGAAVWENAYGYPGEWPFDGGNLYGCAGWSSPEWQVLWFWSETIKISCDMTRGSSGGGWLHAWDGNWGYLNGVNSRIDQIVGPTIMLSPYFDDTAWSLYNATRWL
jgi:hypothetical protein